MRSRFYFQDLLVENLARDWTVSMRLLDQNGDEANNSSVATVLVSSGYATFYGVVFTDLAEQMTLEFTVEGIEITLGYCLVAYIGNWHFRFGQYPKKYL